jgi:hypothetical protein
MQYLILDLGDSEENMQKRDDTDTDVAAPPQYYHRNYRNDFLQLI